ncbi:MAG TPA: serine/threonine-protein kinase [Gemmatimonadales bacterium]|nr:serine/threonine-protein kinase [Gemmatimonadales bacterium]
MGSDVSAEFLALQQVLAGRYSIERELGRGGMGIVLLARDVALDRLVAIKLLPPALAASVESRDRFLREARTAAGLSHPNIVPIHAVEQAGDLVFFVMAFVDGETLRERVERAGPLAPRLAMKVMQEVAWALAYAHQRGVIHRDVKPDNIMIERATDRALVTDFGIAVGGRSGAGGSAGEVVGTARYMSPEQALGETVDARSDLYSLGATMFFALTGRPPFEGSNLPAIITKQVSTPAPRVQTLRAEVPARLADVIDRCLRKEPAQRVQTGDDVARIVGEARGRDLRAPPVLRSFLRNAQVTTMVLLAMFLSGSAGRTPSGSVTVSIQGTGLIGMILIFQLGVVARRLLRDGYTFEDIRTALLAEAQVQREEADEMKQGKWMRRLNSLWHRLWAGKLGRGFFRLAGAGLRKTGRRAMVSADATELVLGRSVLAAWDVLPPAEREAVKDVPQVVERLEKEAEALRAAGGQTERLAETVAALENLRLALLKLRAGTGTVGDLTLWLERAREVGDYVDRRVAAEGEVEGLLKG